MAIDLVRLIAGELNLNPKMVTQTVALLDEGNTIPFIARYRKEATGSMDEEVLRTLQERLEYMRNLEKRKLEIIASIDEQGKLTDELNQQIIAAQKLQVLEDLYLPYRPKRKTRASVARERGLEPLADWIKAQHSSGDALLEAEQYIDAEKEVNSPEDALQGALDIIAEEISETATIRQWVRKFFEKQAVIVTQATGEDADEVYKMYFDFREAIASLPPHRVLAINRGEREKALKTSISVEAEKIVEKIAKMWGINPTSVVRQLLLDTVADSFKRLLQPAIEREVRKNKTEAAEEQAIEIFMANLKSLLLQPPLRNRVVLGIDPAYRTGCKVAVVDAQGKLLKIELTWPVALTKNQDKIMSNKKKTQQDYYKLINEYQVEIVAIGNGTASRETEQFVVEMLAEGKLTGVIKHDVQYIIVDEAGASVYSASTIARKEFPELDVSERSAASIARRLQDPLAELVKIDPRSIGIGQYQHDVGQKRLSDSLKFVVEMVVNNVGVDINSASPSLLSYVAGINETVAYNIVAWREQEGVFTSRQQIKKVPRLGNKAFEQCAGFLRIVDGSEILDNTPIHPESYATAKALLKIVKIEELDKTGIQELAEKLGVGQPTLTDIVEALMRPGRDPRDELQKPLLKSTITSLDDLEVGTTLQGTVRNVVDFGAFVDVGLKSDGLIHISQLSNKFVKHPLEVVQVGQIVTVKVIDIDGKRQRVGLSMK